MKVFTSPECNFIFNEKTGVTLMWGRTKDEDFDVAPFPLIFDFEITEICKGPGGKPCQFCYKGNLPNKGKYTSFDVAKQVIDKLPKMLTQIAFGVDAQCESNPDWFDIFKYSREKSFIPNVTVADITQETADKISDVCGACAVSRYDNKDICYNSLSKIKLKQKNIHQMISQETFAQALETINDIKYDDRLKDLNAIVFLSLKKKGRGIGYHRLTDEQFEELIEKCSELGVSYGFDSCSATKFLKTKTGKKNSQFVEKCESSLSSGYCNVDGDFFPCSFTEGLDEWKEGISIINAESFDDVWFHPRVQNFREKLLSNMRNCPIYNV